MSETFTMTLDGKAVSGESRFGVVNPATGEVFAEAPDCSKTQLDSAMDAAQRAFASWKKDESKRRQALVECANALKTRAAEVAQVLTQEQGKPLAKAMEETIGGVVWFQVTAGLQIPVDVITETPDLRVEVRRKPYGVVGAITPWNFPLLLAIWKIAPALLAGNTIVLKPSPFTPLSTLKLGEILRDVLPAGVVNTISGGDQLGAWVSDHPAVRKISFTGSVATGKKIAIAAAPDLKRVTLELGGNDPAIVLDDVDPKEVAQKLFWGAFENCGQVCSAIKRLYVAESVYPAIVSEIAALAKSVKVGNGLEQGTQLGPINNRPQFQRVRELVEDARQHGAKFVAGGSPAGDGGYFFEPTIVTEVAEGVRIVDEEQFGPALPIMPFRRVEDAIERANATHFGLSGSVWSRDAVRASEIASQLECGTAWVNQHLAIRPDAPFGGCKWSGIGYENGPYGLAAFTELQTLNVAKG
ncbi:betaine-aldehyde dehydrogenase [Myxococcaceae bacterium]|jgi:acyl-CoA reductase-like NAD-dependent aldehyde dehydrogenase|nr:betaine-aldehyde dehydrogenase [Myxococcaceae bacterium]